MSLLLKTRKINALLQNSKGQNFKEMSETLSDIMDATIFIVSLSGKILGYSENHQYQHENLNQLLENGQFPKKLSTIYPKLMKHLQILMWIAYTLHFHQKIRIYL